MILCPVAIAVGCRKCPIVKVCPVKGTIGDYKPGPGPSKAAGTNKARTTRGR